MGLNVMEQENCLRVTWVQMRRKGARLQPAKPQRRWGSMLRYVHLLHALKDDWSEQGGVLPLPQKEAEA